MKHKDKVLAGILLAALLGTSSAFADFEAKNTYAEGTFSDITADEWYSAEVKSAYELGFMNGTGEGLFEPYGDVTVAQAVTVAARASALYLGEEIPASDGAWYDMYVDYAVSKGIIKENGFDDYERPAKRYEVADIFCKAFPNGYYTAINSVEAVPDVPKESDYYNALLSLYNAGVVMGNDSYGNFRPYDNITRAETAAIINRAAIPANRLKKELDVYSDDDAYALILTSGFTSPKEGIASGWQLDNRGGIPRNTLTEPYGALTDISEDAGTALIRKVNTFDTGNVYLYTELEAKGDGVYLEINNKNGVSIYRLESLNGSWNLLLDDGSFLMVYEIKENETDFIFRISIDLDNNRSSFYINDTLCGTHPLAVSKQEADFSEYRFGTTEKSKAHATCATVTAYVNYAVMELCNDIAEKDGLTLPFGWNGEGNVVTTAGTVKLGKDAVLSKSFTPVSGTAIAEFWALLPEKESISYILTSGNDEIIKLTTDENAFYVNGIEIYADYYANLWYRFRIEADMLSQKAVIKVNGRKVGEADFADSCSYIDGLNITNNDETEVRLDEFKVFRMVEHEDYVPEPVKPEGDELYNIGIISCPMWRNGDGHYGWMCITPYDDHEPVSGYYDEGNPEFADWEIKYFVDHGIDFQNFVIFFGKSKGPQELITSARHIFDGYQNAKYSDRMKYTVMLEAAAGSSPQNMEEWKQHYVPFLIENFFKDERYLTIDNKIVFSMLGSGGVILTNLGGVSGFYEAMDYLEDEIKKLGYDGMILMSAAENDSRAADMGFDITYPYNLGNVYLHENAITALENRTKNGVVYSAPTLANGFDHIPWWGFRQKLMSGEEFEMLAEYVREDYLPDNITEKWQKNFVMLGVSNEWGEGTFLYPTAGEDGFAYLDAVMKTFTGSAPDENTNLVPTAAQKARITRLYPQQLKLLRKDGWYEEEYSDDALETVAKYDFSDYNGDNILGIVNPKTTEDGFSGTSADNDPIIYLRSEDVPENLNANEIFAVKIVAKLPKGSRMQLFYITNSNNRYSNDKSVTFDYAETNDFAEYVAYADDMMNFKGIITGIRIDPLGTRGVDFTVKSIEFIKLNETDSISKKAVIDGNEFEMSFTPVKNELGDVIVPFDPAVGMDFRLNCFHEWNHADKVLTLNFTDKVIVYTVGSDKYTVDGVERNLGFTLETTDKLPLIPINSLCEELGYKFELSDNVITIETPAKAYHDEHRIVIIPGRFEFEADGDTLGFQSEHMTLSVSDGYMSCKSTSDFKDPIIRYRGELALNTADYDTMEIRVRYKYDAENIQGLKFYYGTDVNSAHNEGKTIYAKLNSKDSGGEWETYTVDLSAKPGWKDTVVSLRFDPFDASGEMDIDYIRFYKK